MELLVEEQNCKAAHLDIKHIDSHRHSVANNIYGKNTASILNGEMFRMRLAQRMCSSVGITDRPSE